MENSNLGYLLAGPDYGNPCINVAASGTASVVELPATGVNNSGQNVPSLWIFNQADSTAFVAFGVNSAIAVKFATGFPVPGGMSVKVVLPAGYGYAAVQLAGGTGTVTFAALMA